MASAAVKNVLKIVPTVITPLICLLLNPWSSSSSITKHIADQNALPSKAYAALFKNKLPLYQFTAIDVKTRLRFIAYAHSLSFENGLTFMLLVEAWLRAFGVNHPLFYTLGLLS